MKHFIKPETLDGTNQVLIIYKQECYVYFGHPILWKLSQELPSSSSL